MERAYTCVEELFNSDVEGSDCTSHIKIIEF